MILLIEQAFEFNHLYYKHYRNQLRHFFVTNTKGSRPEARQPGSVAQLHREPRDVSGQGSHNESFESFESL